MRIAELGVLPVINIPKPELAVPLAEALIRGGIDAMEVTLRSDIALASLERIHAAHPEMLLCAGTVRAPAQAREAVAAGARCIVAPGMRADVAEVCAGLEVPYMAACVTGTEIETALDFGMNLVKFFPAEPMGGAAALKLLAGPYPQVRFVPTGGITMDNLGEYLSLKSVAACGGSFMAPADMVLREDWEGIAARCRRCMDVSLGFELLHVGINHDDARSAMETADRLKALFRQKTERDGGKSVFGGPGVECMKMPYFWEKGHIAYATRSAERALAYFRRNGIPVMEETLKRNASGRLEFFYLQEQIGGFAVHVAER